MTFVWSVSGTYPTFLQWCYGQRARQDRVGDFARDWCADTDRPRAPTRHRMVAYLQDMGAIDAAIQSGPMAYCEWRSLHRPRPTG